MDIAVLDYTDAESISDELYQNYQKMDESGKDKLMEVLEKVYEIFNTVKTSEKK